MTDLPIEIIAYIFNFVDIKCHICNKRLYPWSMMGYGIQEDNFFWGYKKTQAFYFCLNECYL
tara:strand:+ start:240 stop:425 length:186 start_codon:yes stop_codon:yes gene_type:complete